MLVIHQLLEIGMIADPNTIRQRKYCHPQQRIVFPTILGNELDKRRGVNQVNSYPKPQEGPKNQP